MDNTQQPTQPSQQPTGSGTIPPAAPQPAGMTPQPQKSKKGLIIGLIIGAVVIFIIIPIILVIALVVLAGNDDKKSESNTNTQSSSQEDTQPDASLNATTARYSSDYDAVCKNGSVENAATFSKPYKVVAFSKNSAQVGDSWSSVSLAYDAPYRADHNKIEEVNVVACLEEKSGSATRSRACEFESGGEKVSLDYYAVQYTLAFREAKTGKLIDDSKSINGPATDCPSFISYNRADPKLHAKPDQNAVDTAVRAFAQ